MQTNMIAKIFQFRRYVLLAFALSILGLASCAKEPTSARITPPECNFPDDATTEAPLWVCDAPIENVVLTAVGAYEATQAGVMFQRQQAAAAARTELAQLMRVQVEALVKNFVETTGVGDSETVDRVSTFVGRQITDESLVGSRIYRSMKNPNTGTLFVLVGLNEEETLAALTDYISNAEQLSRGGGGNTSSANNDDAAWQRLKATEAHQELIESLRNQ